jgi:hypothetical protein
MYGPSRGTLFIMLFISFVVCLLLLFPILLSFRSLVGCSSTSLTGLFVVTKGMGNLKYFIVPYLYESTLRQKRAIAESLGPGGGDWRRGNQDGRWR